MITFKFKIADTCVRCEVNYRHTYDICLEHLSEEPEQMSVSISMEEIEAEKARCGNDARSSNSMSYFETLVLYRKICTQLALRKTILIHGSTLETDGEAYLFCAPSGTGKSTHARLWREVLGDRVVMINDDKPLVRIAEDGTPVIYGTPWNGKHHLGANISAPLKHICFIERGEKNVLEPMDASEILPRLVKCTFRPAGAAETVAVLGTLDKIAACVKVWKLKCNMDPEAAKTAYEGMSGKKL